MIIIDKHFLQPRPKRILALHIADREVEYLWARRQGKGWKLDPIRKAAAQGEGSVFDALRGLSLAPEGRAASALAVFLSLPHYAMHRELYPLALKDDLDKAIAFDWQENSLLEEGRSAVFSGDPAAGEDQIAVPIFSIGSDFLEKLAGAINLSAFKGFTIIPSASGFQKLVSRNGRGRGLTALGGSAGPGKLEMHLFNEGGLLESTLIQPGSVSLRLLQEKLEALAEEGGGEDGAKPAATILCAEACPAMPGFSLDEPDSPVRRETLAEPLLSAWMKLFLEDGVFKGYGRPIDLRPFRLPREAVAAMGLIALFLLLGAWTTYENDSLSDELLQLRSQKKVLEAQLAPQEELQRRIEALQAGEKARQGFQERGVPALDVIRLLTEQTPDEAWYNYMTLKDDQITLQGETTSTVRLITILSKVEGFEEVRLSSPVRNNPSSAKERFSLQIKTNPAGLHHYLQVVYGGAAPAQASGQAPDQSAGQPAGKASDQPAGGASRPAQAGKPAAGQSPGKAASKAAARPQGQPAKGGAPNERFPGPPPAATPPDIPMSSGIQEPADIPTPADIPMIPGQPANQAGRRSNGASPGQDARASQAPRPAPGMDWPMIPPPYPPK